MDLLLEKQPALQPHAAAGGASGHPHDPRCLSQLFQVSVISQMAADGRLQRMDGGGGGGSEDPDCPAPYGLEPCSKSPPPRAAAPQSQSQRGDAGASGGGAANPVLRFPSEQLRALAEAAWAISIRESAAGVLDNTMIVDVGAALRAALAPLSPPPQVTFGAVCPVFHHVVDIAVADGAVPGVRGRLAVQVDGKTRYLQCADTRWWVQDGSTAMRDRCLASAGWTVVVVPCAVWRKLGVDSGEKEAYLRRKLFPGKEQKQRRREGGGGGVWPEGGGRGGGVVSAR